MHRGDNHVQLGQDHVGEVEAAVLQDVALGPGQDPDRVTCLHRADLGALLAQALHAEALRDRERARVVGHDDVLVAAGLGRLDEALERMVAVRPLRVVVKVAA